MPFLHGVELVEIDSGSRPIQVASSSVIGIVGTAPDADPAVFPLNTPVLIAGSPVKASKLVGAAGSWTGTLPAAVDGVLKQAGAVIVVVRVEDGVDEAETMANVIGGTNSVTGAAEGAQALLMAESVLGVAPRILIAPGWTHQRPVVATVETANPVVASLLTIATRMRAVIFADGPNTTHEAVIAAEGDSGSARVYLVEPWVKVMDPDGALVDVPASAHFAGVQARSDAERGYWWSLSNQELFGVVGLGRPIDFRLGDAAAEANILNENGIGTVVRHEGFRTWGNRSQSVDPKWQFLSVRRTADIINDSLQRAHLWAVDRNITATYLEEVAEGVNAFLRTQKALGAILGGRCWPDPDLNSPAAIANGEVYFNFEFTPPYPAEHITFRSHLVEDYLVEVLGAGV